MREWVKLLLLIVGLAVYGVQALSAQHHVHDLHDRSPCAACMLHDTPVTPPAARALPLPKPPAPPLVRAVHRDVDPPRALTPEDVSPSTSPPARPSRVS